MVLADRGSREEQLVVQRTLLIPLSLFRTFCLVRIHSVVPRAPRVHLGWFRVWSGRDTAPPQDSWRLLRTYRGAEEREMGKRERGTERDSDATCNCVRYKG